MNQIDESERYNNSNAPKEHGPNTGDKDTATAIDIIFHFIYLRLVPYAQGRAALSESQFDTRLS